MVDPHNKIIFPYSPRITEMRRGAVGIGKSDVFTMKDVLNRGLWEDPLMDPQTYVFIPLHISLPYALPNVYRCKAGSLCLPLGK